jgi:hypothetical protein
MESLLPITLLGKLLFKKEQITFDLNWKDRNGIPIILLFHDFDMVVAKSKGSEIMKPDL